MKSQVAQRAKDVLDGKLGEAGGMADERHFVGAWTPDGWVRIAPRRTRPGRPRAAARWVMPESWPTKWAQD